MFIKHTDFPVDVCRKLNKLCILRDVLAYMRHNNGHERRLRGVWKQCNSIEILRTNAQGPRFEYLLKKKVLFDMHIVNYLCGFELLVVQYCIFS
jgi:hypothetical protein